METLFNIFTTLPVSVSTLTLTLAVALFTGLSVLFLEAVKFIINQKAWKTGVINSKVIFDKVVSLIFKKEHIVFVTYRDSDHYIFESEDKYGKFVWAREDGSGRLQIFDGNVVNIWSYRTECATYFDTEEEALGSLSGSIKTKDSLVLKPFICKILSLVAVTDLLLILFKLAPFEALILTGICTLVGSIRWVSGKLADNVSKTTTHEERITKLEQEER